MAASGFTPISLYNTSTSGTAPTAGNLTNGELAINIADGNLYFKNSSGNVTVLANQYSAIGVFLGTGSIQLPNGTTAQRPSSAVTSLGTITGGTGYTNGTYTGVQLSYVSGPTGTTYPTANITVVSGAVSTVTIVTGGSGFSAIGTVLTASNSLIGGTGSGFSVPVATLTPAQIRFNSTLNQFEGYNGTAWVTIGAASAGGSIYENTRTIAASYTITAGNGADSVGPIILGSGVSITIPATSRWVIL